MSLNIQGISQVRQKLPLIVKEMKNTKQELIVVSNSKPVMVMMTFDMWQELKDIKEEKEKTQYLQILKNLGTSNKDLDGEEDVVNYDPNKVKKFKATQK